MNEKISLEKLVAYCGERGFVFAGSEIYGGLANAWDYGPLGVELLGNIKKAWWKKMVQENPNIYGVDAAIIMNRKVWEASGHAKRFGDPLSDCKHCKVRHRVDKLIEDFSKKTVNPGGWSYEQMFNYLIENKVKCPSCGKVDYSEIRQFNMMLSTHLGVVSDEANKVFLRPETAQGEYVNFKNVQRSMRAKLPFGIAQIGKSFRNEITPGKFIFRTREFEQMEEQFFCRPSEEDKWYEYWKNFCMDFLISLGIKKEDLRFRQHDKDELAHYCKTAFDVEYNYPFGFEELWGIHNRTDYDLKNHQEQSGESMEYFDSETGEKVLPYCIETAVGAGRLMLVTLFNSYKEEKLENDDTRTVLSIHPFLSPYKFAVLPLIKKKHSEKSMEIFKLLAKSFMGTYDETASIGKRYRRQDEIGTPVCITIDDNTLEHGTVTIRDRDSMSQITLKIEDVTAYLNKLTEF